MKKVKISNIILLAKYSVKISPDNVIVDSIMVISMESEICMSSSNSCLACSICFQTNAVGKGKVGFHLHHPSQAMG